MFTHQNFKNFAVLTVNVQSVEQKTSKEGKPYALAAASLPMTKGNHLPLRVVALNGISTSIQPGQLTLVGRLGYEEKDGEGVVVLFPTKVEAAPADGKLRNYVVLTLRVGQDAEPRYAETGNFWTRVRMALGQGKDAGGNYKPSLWLTVKGFTVKGDETVAQALSELNKGDMATITGRLVNELSPTNGKSYLNLMAIKVEKPEPEEAAVEEDCPY
jgi:hypothetical protein